MQNAINLAFIQQLRMSRFHAFQFNRDFFSSRHVGAEVNISKGTASNLAAQAVFLPNAKLHSAD
jgi:hypothetical protein